MRIAVIGLGSIGRRHALNFSSLGCDVRLYDPVPGIPVITEGHASEFYKTAEGAMDGADGVVVATPPESHIPIACDAIMRGCHVMIEKPLALTDIAVEGMLHLAAAERRTVMVAYPWRYDAGMRLAIAQAQALPPDLVFAHYGYNTGNATATGMGALLDCSHIIDVMRWMLGEPKRVKARGTHLHSAVRMDFGGAEVVAELALDVPLVRKWEAAGGTSTVTWVRNDLDVNAMYLEEARHFLACIRGVAAPLSDGWDGLRTLRVALAAQTSARSGQWVTL